jgi:SM-20-related protein
MIPSEVLDTEIPIAAIAVVAELSAGGPEVNIVLDRVPQIGDQNLPLDPFAGELSPELEMELLCDRIAAAIESQGYIVLPQFLPNQLTLSLAQHLSNEHELELKRAGIGRDGDFQLNGDVRRDKIQWLEPGIEIVTQFLSWMDTLRTGLNRRLFLGLREFESHFAVYEPGAFYHQHLDAFKGAPSRKLSTVLYLNECWVQGDGGELLLYDDAGVELLETVAPKCGVMVVFLSEEFPHEVLVTHRRRQSIAGWYRI